MERLARLQEKMLWPFKLLFIPRQPLIHSPVYICSAGVMRSWGSLQIKIDDRCNQEKKQQLHGKSYFRVVILFSPGVFCLTVFYLLILMFHSLEQRLFLQGGKGGSASLKKKFEEKIINGTKIKQHEASLLPLLRLLHLEVATGNLHKWVKLFEMDHY